MIGRMARYGLVKLRIIFDDNRKDDFVVYQVYDPQRQEWVEVSKEVADEIAEGAVKPVAGGFLVNGLHMTLAIPRRRLGRYERYVVEWVDELPKQPVMVNEGVMIIYEGSDERGDHFRIVPIKGPRAMPGGKLMWW